MRLVTSWGWFPSERPPPGHCTSQEVAGHERHKKHTVQREPTRNELTNQCSSIRQISIAFYTIRLDYTSKGTLIKNQTSKNQSGGRFSSVFSAVLAAVLLPSHLSYPPAVLHRSIPFACPPFYPNRASSSTLLRRKQNHRAHLFAVWILGDMFPTFSLFYLLGTPCVG